jgi:transcriptional regulator with XRE-family HTH domain
MSIGSRITRRREELGLSVDDLAAKIGKNRSTVYRYENGDIENVPVAALSDIAEALAVPPAWLMGYDSQEGLFKKPLTMFGKSSDNVPEKENAVDPLDQEIMDLLATFDTEEKKSLVQFLQRFSKHGAD